MADPEHIRVAHILTWFAGGGPEARRGKADAERRAGEVLARAKKGEDFAGLIKQLSDDSGDGVYGMANVKGAPAKGEYQRQGMVPAFGDVGFVLEVGGIGMSAWDARKSPYGWHIIKRLK